MAVVYMVIMGSSDGAFFKYQNGQPLTKSKFISHVRIALAAVRITCDKFAGHGFHIGAATEPVRQELRIQKSASLDAGIAQLIWGICPNFIVGTCSIEQNIGLTILNCCYS